MTKNTFKKLPDYQKDLNLERAAGFTFGHIKLLKVQFLGLAPFPEEITRKNIFKTAMVCQCDCGNYCIFNFKKLTHPDFLPACGKCNQALEKFINQYFNDNKILLSPKQAWEKLGYSKDKKITSRLYWYGNNRNNAFKMSATQGTKLLSDDDLFALNAPRYLYLSRAAFLSPKQGDVNNLNIVYRCMCNLFASFNQRFLEQFEPIGMCSLCTEELRYFFADYSLTSSLTQLDFKHMWKDYLRAKDLPYVEFRYVWEEYFKARTQVRKDHQYELHLSDYIPQYYEKYLAALQE